jgi:hypothetical protein
MLNLSMHTVITCTHGSAVYTVLWAVVVKYYSENASFDRSQNKNRLTDQNQNLHD